jgi:hypothetical protein
MCPNTDQTTEQTRVTVAQAAQILGLSAEAVRMRIKRGTLKHVKDENTVYVLLDHRHLDTDQTQPNDKLSTKPTTDQTALIQALRAEVEFLREEMRRREERHTEEARRKDHLLAAALERIPELEAPREASESRQSAAEDDGRGEGRGGEEGPPHRPWYHRIFGH